MDSEDDAQSTIEWAVDELYLIALQDHDEVPIFPISDEAYAEELQLQEILFPDTPVAPTSMNSRYEVQSSSLSLVKIVEEKGESSMKLCSICMDCKPSNMFFAATNCNHSFCVDCISQYVATKIQENISTVKCPEANCKATINPSDCSDVVPKQVVERWESALVESLMIESGTALYCPFKDCSALLLNDDDVAGSAECPSCHRLFCAQCKVAWHEGLPCAEFQNLPEADRSSDDVLAIKLAKGKSWRRCPKCLFYVDKASGCLHITCRCSFEFCYGCGSNWSLTHACP